MARTRSSETDDKGNYTLRRTRKQSGAYIGEHRVRIVTDSEAANPILLPARYVDETELRFTVESGSNVANFDLTSK